MFLMSEARVWMLSEREDDWREPPIFWRCVYDRVDLLAKKERLAVK